MLGVYVFYIEILKDSCDDPAFDAYGKIVVGDFSERFGVVLVSGCISDLAVTWADEIRQLLVGKESVALRTQPQFAWVLYRDGCRILVTEQFLGPGWPGEFDADGRIRAIPPFQSRNEDGESVSYWETTVGAIRGFLGRADA